MKQLLERVYARQRLVSHQRDMLRRRMEVAELAAWAMVYLVVVAAMALSMAWQTVL